MILKFWNCALAHWTHSICVQGHMGFMDQHWTASLCAADSLVMNVRSLILTVLGYFVLWKYCGGGGALGGPSFRSRFPKGPIDAKLCTRLKNCARETKIKFTLPFVLYTKWKEKRKIEHFGLTFGRKGSCDSVTGGPIFANLVSKYP